MAISDALNDREHDKFRESVATPGVPAVAIVNPDGTNIGGSGGTSMTDNTAYVQGASSLTPTGYLGDDVPTGLGADERVGIPRMRRSTRVPFAELVDQSGDSVGDDTNNALRVNVVAGGAGGGVAQTQVRNAGDTAWENVGRGAAQGKMPTESLDGAHATIGATTDADTANTLVGRLKQIITTLQARLPAALVGGRLDSNTGAWLGSTAPTVGQKAMASSVPVALASDQSALTVTDGGAGKTLKRAVVALTATGDVIAAVASRRLKVFAYELQSRNDSMTVQLRNATTEATTLGIRWALNTREGAVHGAINPPAFLFATIAGEALEAVITGTGTVDIAVSYWDDDAT
jgi:hypothetical protein